MSNTRRSAFRSSISSQPSTPTSSPTKPTSTNTLPLQLRKAMKKLFNKSNNQSQSGLGTLPSVPIVSAKRASDCSSSGRGKSLDVRPESANGLLAVVNGQHRDTASSTTSIGDAHMKASLQPPSSPLSTIKQRLRPKSQPPPPLAASAAAREEAPPTASDAANAHPAPTTTTHTSTSKPSGLRSPDSGYASHHHQPQPPPSLPVHEVKLNGTGTAQNNLPRGVPTSNHTQGISTSATDATITQAPPSRPYPPPPPIPPQVRTQVIPPPTPPSNLRLRVDSANLPPRLPPFSSSLFDGLPSSAYSSSSSQAGGGPSTPHPPGGFHTRARSMTSPASPISPRRLANASTPGTYVMPLGDLGSGGGTTMKMTPSLVLATPMTMPRYPSLLVNGVSGGELERSRTEGANGENSARSSPARPMRSALPALRRDGSSFYMNMARSDVIIPPGIPGTLGGPADSSDDDDDDIMMHDDDDEEDAASDDEEPAPTPRTPMMLGGLGKAVKAMASPLASVGGSSPQSYFRRQRSGSGSGSGGAGMVPTTPAAHRMSIIAPSGLGTTVEDEQDESLPQQQSSTPKPGVYTSALVPSSPSQSPASTQRETVYLTPLATPTPEEEGEADEEGSDNRATMYFDADMDSMDDLQDLAATASAFTTGTASTITTTTRRPAPPITTPSMATITPTRPAVEHADSSGSGESALGLEGVPAAAPLPSPRTTRERAPSASMGMGMGWDYFSTPSMDTPRMSGMGMARTPGGRPAMYKQVSQSMLEVGRSGMGMGEDVVASPSRKGKEKEPALPTYVPSTPKPTDSAGPMARRKSLPDLRTMPPPYPKISPPREEEGREQLPPYTCRIHFEASLLRKMEFSHPGVLARDRAWKRVYVVLNGTGLTVFKSNPRVSPVKGGRPGDGEKVYEAGGKRGDGVTGVEDLVVGAPHVHLPQDVLDDVHERVGVPMGRVTSRGSAGSERRSLDGGASGSGSRRRSLDGGTSRRAGGSRSSMSSGTTTTTTTTTTTGTTSLSSMDLTLDPSSEKQRPEHLLPQPPSNPVAASFGIPRPSNSQSSHPSTFLASLQSNVVLRRYGLANAETGLASDYHKRKNVIRVRAEGEQFLLQADNVLMAIDWIETFQAGANVALDLDERPMPKVPALPRRRRRRRATRDDGTPAPAPANGNGNGASAGAQEPSPSTQPQPQSAGSSSRFSFGRHRNRDRE